MASNSARTRSDQPDASDLGLGSGKSSRGAVRTAWIVGGIAVAIYIAFVLSGVLRA